MSSINPSPMPPATAERRGTMSATDKAKLDAIAGTNTGNVTVSSPAGWLSLAGQALTFALVAASDTVAGVVSLGAQIFAGAKTFTSAIIASAGIQLASLWNTNGTGSTDVGVKVGVSTQDGLVNANAKILSVRTGIGGTEVEKAYLLKSGAFTAAAMNASDASSAGGVQFAGTAVLWESGSTLVLRARGSAANYDSTTPAIWLVPSGAVDATDLILSVATSAGVARFTVNGQGDTVAQGTSQLNAGGVARPTANAANRGTLWYSRSANGAADTVQICVKSAADTYSWVTIATG